MAEKILFEKNLVSRHCVIELIEHWAIAISGLVLLLTGIFELPVAKRYYVITVPGLGWSADFITSLYLHYTAALVFTVTGVFHLVYHGIRGEKGMIPRKGDMAESVTVIKSLFGIGQEPPLHKYLPEQRLAYVGMAFIIVMLIISGLIKTYKNIYAPDMSLKVVLTATWVHNIFFVLFFLAFLGHMAAIALRPNWPMVRGIFTGNVRLDYARHRHALWLADIENNETDALAVKSEPDLPITAKSPLPQTQVAPQQNLLPEVEGQPTIISNAEPNQQTTPENKE
jgi:cytochrome b subunit of formate dehydrogenase